MKGLHLKYIAFTVSALVLFQSCAAYRGNYSLGHAVENEKKVKVTFRYDEYLVYKGVYYGYDRTNDLDFWTRIDSEEGPTMRVESKASENGSFPDIFRNKGTYYGVTDVTDHTTWKRIEPTEIRVETNTQEQTYKKIVYQEGHYFGVPKNDFDTPLEIIYENEVEKVSYYDPILSVLGSILMAPILVLDFLIYPLGDD